MDRLQLSYPSTVVDPTSLGCFVFHKSEQPCPPGWDHVGTGLLPFDSFWLPNYYLNFRAAQVCALLGSQPY